MNLCLYDEIIRHEPNPVYLGVTLDRSLSLREHLQKTAAKSCYTKQPSQSTGKVILGRLSCNAKNIGSIAL